MLVALGHSIPLLILSFLFIDGAPREEDECGIWFAPSSIPNTGIGMYAGRSFDEGETLSASGELTIPFIDIERIHGTEWDFLWFQYTWEAGTVLQDNEAKAVDVASCGFGSAANSFLDLQNVNEGVPELSLAGLHRSKDPGAGAFSPYHNRIATAGDTIKQGQELFVSYGNEWFYQRTDRIGPVPVNGDLPLADKLLKQWNRLQQKFNDTISGTVMRDLLETFAWNSPFADSSRVLFALPKNWNETEMVLEHGLVNYRKSQSTKSLEWLHQNGICGDNIREDISTIPQAGRGAFATRNIVNGSILAPLPMIHVPNRTKFEIYYSTGEIGHQLMLNYCFGHRRSTLLLCPYGLLTGLINHSRGRANVKLSWSDPSRSSHNPEWLNLTVKELDMKPFAGIAMELVALRDMEQGEEILLDYGSEWEEAWKNHISSWKPLPNSDKYVSADELNNLMNKKKDYILKTVFDEIDDPYPTNTILKLDKEFIKRRKWLKHLSNGTLMEFKKEQAGDLIDCEILRWEKANDGRLYYTGVYAYEKDGEMIDKLFNRLPREAFVFRDRAYTGDFHQHNVFRHDMRIPDEMFPDAWMNI